jgi:hypothetical protein
VQLDDAHWRRPPPTGDDGTPGPADTVPADPDKSAAGAPHTDQAHRARPDRHADSARPARPAGRPPARHANLLRRPKLASRFDSDEPADPAKPADVPHHQPGGDGTAYLEPARAPHPDHFPTPPKGLAYDGPPPSTAPPKGWHPPRIVEPAPPRRLPPQDHQRLDEEEARARTFTQGMSLVVGAILLIVLLAVCARALF